MSVFTAFLKLVSLIPGDALLGLFKALIGDGDKAQALKRVEVAAKAAAARRMFDEALKRGKGAK